MDSSLRSRLSGIALPTLAQKENGLKIAGCYG
jgi:hypothetical protein